MARTNRNETWQGMNWIRQEKRLAIYLRDGLACAWCGSSVEDGAQLSLDHVIPHVDGGSNKETNLVTACSKCNSVRQDRSAATFAAACALYINGELTAEAILADVAARTAKALKPFVAEAKDMIARRGSAAKVLAERIR